MTAADWAPPHARPLARAVIAATRADPRIVGLTAGGSAATRTMDEFSDLDFVVVSRNEHQPDLLREAPGFAASLGPLLGLFHRRARRRAAVAGSRCTGRRRCTST